MSERVTATEAARNFSDLLNRVRYGRETFVVLRGGEEVAQITPAESGRFINLAGLLDLVLRNTPADPSFADDLEEIQASQPPLGEAPPWPS